MGRETSVYAGLLAEFFFVLFCIRLTRNPCLPLQHEALLLSLPVVHGPWAELIQLLEMGPTTNDLSRDPRLHSKA